MATWYPAKSYKILNPATGKFYWRRTTYRVNMEHETVGYIDHKGDYREFSA